MTGLKEILMAELLGGTSADAAVMDGAGTAGEGLPQGQTMVEHMKRYHPHGFDPEHDDCKYFEQVKEELECDVLGKCDVGKKWKDGGKRQSRAAASGGWDGKAREEAEHAAKVLQNCIRGVRVKFSKEPYAERQNDRSGIAGLLSKDIRQSKGLHVEEGPLKASIERILDEGIVDVRLREGEREKLLRAALGFHRKYGDMRLPISTGGEMFFAPSHETLARHGGNIDLAWAEYAIHAVTNGNMDKDGKRYRTFGKEKVEKVNPLIEEIVAEDKVVIEDNKALYFTQIDDGHIGRLVARPENGNLRIDDLMEVTSTYVGKRKIPDTAMPLVRAVEAWTARGDIPNPSTDKDSIADDVSVGKRVGEKTVFRGSDGNVVGEYDRNTGEITLYPGAKVSDVVHEFSHGLWQFAEQEAKAGRRGLLGKMHEIAQTAPQAVKEAVAANYPEVSDNVYLEECFANELARRSDTAFAKAIGTSEGKPWYKRAWGTIKDIWRGATAKVGLNKANMDKIGDMSPDEAAQHILSEMAKGKTFGALDKLPPNSASDSLPSPSS